METYIGSIHTVGFNFAPRGSSFCNGQLLPINNNEAVFALLGTTFGGDGRTTLGLPDLQGRSPVGVGQGKGLSTIMWGQSYGSELTTLSLNNLPQHSHVAEFNPSGGGGSVEVSVMASKKAGDTSAKDNAVLANATEGMGLQTAYAANPADADLVSLGGVRVQGGGGGGGTVSVGNTGSNQAFEIRNPYLGLYHIISLVGVFPSRN